MGRRSVAHPSRADQFSSWRTAQEVQAVIALSHGEDHTLFGIL